MGRIIIITIRESVWFNGGLLGDEMAPKWSFNLRPLSYDISCCDYKIWYLFCNNSLLVYLILGSLHNMLFIMQTIWSTLCLVNKLSHIKNIWTQLRKSYSSSRLYLRIYKIDKYYKRSNKYINLLLIFFNMRYDYIYTKNKKVHKNQSKCMHKLDWGNKAHSKRA